MRRLDLSGPRPRYEPPRIQGLGSLDAAVGGCNDGGSPSGKCQTGQTNTEPAGCTTGVVNTDKLCQMGQTNSGTSGCRTGTTNSGGAGSCGGGSYVR
jgi:hypothetical protein